MKEGSQGTGFDVVEAKIMSLVKEIYLKGKKDVSLHFEKRTSLIKDLGFDSVEVLGLIVNIEKELNIKVPDEYLLAEYFDTPASIIKTIKGLLRKSGYK